MAVVQVSESNKGFPLLILTAACGGGIVPQKQGHYVSMALWIDHIWSSGTEQLRTDLRTSRPAVIVDVPWSLQTSFCCHLNSMDKCSEACLDCSPPEAETCQLQRVWQKMMNSTFIKTNLQRLDAKRKTICTGVAEDQPLLYPRHLTLI